MKSRHLFNRLFGILFSRNRRLCYLKWKGNKPFKITNIISLLAKSLGVEREHALEPFFFSKDMEGVLKKFKDNIKASKYSEDDYRMTLGRFIGVQSKGK